MSYAAQSDIEDIFSPANIAAWSLFETGAPGGSADATRIATALAHADSQIDAFFAGGPYAVPLVCNICKPIVTYWAAVIAGVWLYGGRTTATATDYAGNRYLALHAAVFQDIDLYKSGLKRLDAMAKYPHPTAPTPTA